MTKQLPEKPLFPNILWNRPENKNGAGKLAIFGGNSHKFFAPAQAAMIAQSAGIGVVKVLMPEATKKLVGKSQDIEFAPSNPSGSFAKDSLANMIDLSLWADAVLFAGDAGHNSETATVLESFLSTYKGQATITQDCLDMFVNNAEAVMQRPHTLLVTSFSQLQKLAKSLRLQEPFTYSMPFHALAEQLHAVTTEYPAYIITVHQGQILIAVGGRVAHMQHDQEVWRVEQSAKSAVYWLQQPETAFETITTSLLSLNKLQGAADEWS